jgi:hypothetical protein
MADLKISALTASTTPLAGTEVLPIVQSSATVKVAVSNLTAGRTVSGLNFISGSDTTNFNVVAGSTTTGPGISAYGKTAAAAAGWVVYTSGTADFVGTHAWYKNDFAGTATYLGGWYSNGDYKLDNGNVVIGTSGKGIDFSATPGTGTSELLNDYEEGTWTPGAGAGLTVVGTLTVTGRYTKIGRQVTVIGLFEATSLTVTGSQVFASGLPFTSSSTTKFGTGVVGGIWTTATGAVIFENSTNISAIENVAASGAVTFTVTYFV